MTLENTLAPRKLEFGIHSIADLKQLLQDALPGANIMANHHVQTDSTHSLESQATHCGIASVPSVPMATCISRNFRFHSQNTIQWQIRQPRTNALHRRVSVPEFLTHLIQQLREQHVDLDGTADALHRSPGRPRTTTAVAGSRSQRRTESERGQLSSSSAPLTNTAV